MAIWLQPNINGGKREGFFQQRNHILMRHALKFKLEPIFWAKYKVWGKKVFTAFTKMMCYEESYTELCMYDAVLRIHLRQ